MKQHLAAPGDLVDVRGIAEPQRHQARATGPSPSAPRPATMDVRHQRRRQGAIFRRWPHWRAGSAIRRCARWAPLGGSVANNDPAADYPAAVLGLGATVVTSKREIAADDFFQGMFTTGGPWRKTRSSPPSASPVPTRAGYSKFRNPASLYAMAGGCSWRRPMARVRRGGDRCWRGRRCSGTTAWRRRWSSDFSAGAPQRRVDLRGRNAQRHSRHRGLPGEPRQGHGQARGGERRLRLTKRGAAAPAGRARLRPRRSWRSWRSRPSGSA